MNEKQEYSNPTLSDWQKACLEITKHAPQYVDIVANIQPYAPPYVPETGKTGKDAPIFFTEEGRKLLKSLVERLAPAVAKQCSTLMRLFSRATTLSAPYMTHEFTAETAEKHLAPYMDRKTLSSLMSTCRFFYTSKALRSQRDALPKYRICAGDYHTLLFTQDKLLVCGYNRHGQLGLGHTSDQFSFTDALSGVLLEEESILQVAAGYGHTLVLTSQQRLLVCGYNSSGQLGLGNTKDQNSFTNALAEILQQGEIVTQLVAGLHASLILTSRQRLLVCGLNKDYQLGSHAKIQYSFMDALAGVLMEGECVLQVATENRQTLLLTSQQRLLVPRYNSSAEHSNSQLILVDALAGVLQEGETVLQLVAGSNHSLVLTSKQRLLGWGSIFCYEQDIFTDVLAGVLLEREAIIQIAAGSHHTLVLTNQQRLLACGNNSSGQLGHTDWQNNHFVEVPLTKVLAEGEIVLQVAAGDNHSLLLTSQGRLLVCGDNKHGQLGMECNGKQISFVSHPLFDKSAQEKESENPNNCSLQ